MVYCASHVPTVDGKLGGLVTAVEVTDGGSGVRELNQRVVPNPHPAFAQLDRTGRFLMLASTVGGGVCVFGLEPDGSIGECTSVVHHEGRTTEIFEIGETGFPVLPSSAPLPHCVLPDLANRFVLVCDVRLNRVFTYALDADTGVLTPGSAPWAAAHPGAGPRHLAVHPEGRVIFVVNETDSTVSVYDYQPESGALAERHFVSTLPAGWSGHNMTSEVHLDPTGSWLYVANRGHDSVAVFAVDESFGLEMVQVAPTRGAHPRTFCFTPDGRHLLIANQHSNCVAVLDVDPVTGRLAFGGVLSDIPAPTCIGFVGGPF
jgi:6-phosphogluconolactonase